MKFNEKLIELRKREGLSQEELGYKLNVTRQTVSKWELGQTTPEMEKLVEMSRLFNISVDELINENEELNNSNEPIADQPIVEKSSKNNRVIILLSGVLILIVAYIVVKLFTGFTLFNKATDMIKDAQNKGTEQVFDLLDNGTNKVLDLLDKGKEMMDNQVQSNTNIEENMGNQFNSFMNNLNSINNEYVNEMNETKNKAEIDSFNSSIELYDGTAPKLFAETVLDNIVTSNKKNDRQIIVKYNKTETKDETEIKNIKKKIHNMSDFVSFDISCEYDEEGYIYEVTIEKM